MTDDPDRRRRHVDHGVRDRARTPRIGVPVIPQAIEASGEIDPLARTEDELAEDFDSLTPPPQVVDDVVGQLLARHDFSPADAYLARAVSEAAVGRLGESLERAYRKLNDRLLAAMQQQPGSDQTMRRMAALEVWRDEIVAWRLKLTGVADTNGRLGQMDRAISAIREDVGTPKEAKATRDAAADVHAVKRRMWAALGGAAFALGGLAFTLWKDHSASLAADTRADARLELRVEQLEKALEKYDSSLRPSWMSPPSAPTPASVPRTDP